MERIESMLNRIATSMVGLALVTLLILGYYAVFRPSWSPWSAIIMLSGSLGLLSSWLMLRMAARRGRSISVAFPVLNCVLTAALVYAAGAWLVNSVG